MRREIIGMILTSLVLAAGARAEEPMVLPRMEGVVRLDGVSDEPGWRKISPLPLTLNLPTFGGPPTELTEIRVAYDDQYLYALGRFADSDPEGIRGNFLERDGEIWRDDGFALVLDTFNDNENAVAFTTTPSGVRKDFTVFDDAEPSWATPYNTTWNTFWDAAVVRTAEGWGAEMRIPLSSLRFQDRDGRVVMGMTVWRYIARKNEIATFPAIPSKWYWGTIKPSIAQDVVLTGVRGRRPVQVTPFGAGGFGQASPLNDAGTGFESDTALKHEAGLDLKYGLTSNMTLDATVNTDFAQVEADDEQVNLTRFSLFFPEKRLFFLERASTFDFKTEGDENLFYSRRIGLSEDGPVRILGGVRLVGRTGRWDVGLLDLQTAGRGAVPSENSGVVRVRRQTFNKNSSIGGIATVRSGADGSTNLAYGLDGVVRVRGDDYVTIKWAQTAEDAPEGVRRTPSFHTGRLSVRWERRTYHGFGYETGIARAGGGFNPGLGFTTRSDYTRVGDRLFYGWYMKEASAVESHILSLRGVGYLRNADGSVESSETGPEWSVTMKSGAAAQLNLKRFEEDLREPFDLSEGVSVPGGRYRYYGLNAAFQSPYGSPRRLDVSVDAGTFYDGSRFTFTLTPTLALSRHLEVAGEYQVNRVRFSGRRQSLNAQVARVRLKASVNTRLSASAFVQYSGEDHLVGVNFRLRYNPREGNDFYLVYNEGLNTDRDRTLPRLPTSDSRTVLVKYSRTFIR